MALYSEGQFFNPKDFHKPTPFLRWAGGKRWFLKHLQVLVSNFTFRNYHEPFLGSAAVFLHLNPTGKSYLSDVNVELIETYQAVQKDVEKVISALKGFENTKECYYRIRDAKFRNEFKCAARFIYLNQTSFNGIYRVNLEGVYNVPYGFRKKNFFEPDNLRSASYKIKNAVIRVADFEALRSGVKREDLVFLDPPYTISHNNNGFIKYNQKLFSLEDQYRLSALIDTIKQAGAYYILTNAAHQKVEEIFEKGDRKVFLKRASLIGGQNAVRGKFEEIVFTNIK